MDHSQPSTHRHPARPPVVGETLPTKASLALPHPNQLANRAGSTYSLNFPIFALKRMTGTGNLDKRKKSTHVQARLEKRKNLYRPFGATEFSSQSHGQFVHNLVEKTPALANAVVTYSKPQLATFWYYAKVELVPPTPAEIPTAVQSLKKIVISAQTGSFKQLTVKEAVLNGLVATEVLMWFYVGEIIGKCGIIDYDV
nr:ATP synthase subunit g, mitochondrial-like [Macaca fascicularis]